LAEGRGRIAGDRGYRAESIGCRAEGRGHIAKGMGQRVWSRGVEQVTEGIEREGRREGEEKETDSGRLAVGGWRRLADGESWRTEKAGGGMKQRAKMKGIRRKMDK
jgi:hypothetical protein